MLGRSEPARPASPLAVVPSEAVLQHGWATAPPARLRDTAGGSWRVLFAGTWNHGPGPDFRDALLLPPWGAPLRGDVEIHREVAAWGRHGHDRDSGYGGVILHLYAHGQGLALGQDGAGAASRFGPRRRAAIASGSPADPPPCSRVVARAGRMAVSAALRRLSRERMQAKSSRIEAGAGPGGGDDARAYSVLLATLGRGGNESLFEQVAVRLPWAAIAADAAGGEAAALGLRLQAALPAPLPPHRGRPANAPRRRLDGAAALITRLTAAGEGSLARGLVRLSALPESQALTQLRAPGLLGSERARQILVDAVYPLARSLGGGDELVRRWLCLGGARYQRTQPLRARLEAGGLTAWRNGETQALLSLERCYCRAGACAVCPLARLARLRPSRGPRPSPNAAFEPGAASGPA